MTGTAKQIAYATDIINKTITRIDEVIAKGTAKVETREAGIRTQIADYTDTANRKIIGAWGEGKDYLETIAEMPELSAADVISFEKEMTWFEYISHCVVEKCGASAIS